MEAEFSGALWFLGMTTFAPLPDGTVACTYTKDARDHLALVSEGLIRTLDAGLTAAGVIPGVCALGHRVAVIGATSTTPFQLQLVDPATSEIEVVRRSSDQELDPACISVPRPFEFTAKDGSVGHALHFAPVNDAFAAQPEEKPPLLVMSHGGPTGAKGMELDLAIQFFTTRGIAVCHVNYGGSTGYGRAYRERLRGQMGVVDVEDCVAAALHLVEEGLVDGERLAIRGGSAGGWVTLCAVTFHDIFKAGTSYWGIADLRALVETMHKFESRYFDGLIGRLPEAAGLYERRSPLYNIDRLRCPLLVIQGLDDTIVKPEQAEMMVDALRSKGIPHAYLTFEGEGHGLRKAENMRRATEAELYFYSRILGFETSDELEPIPIESL
jgi:dipeptidyl aminopeptidase/acylaminoacyl peptidase